MTSRPMMSTRGYWCDMEHEICDHCEHSDMMQIVNFTAFTLDGSDVTPDGWHTCGNCTLAWRATETCEHEVKR